MSAIDDIAAERRRQVEVEGWSSAHDDQHAAGEIAAAAALYATNASVASRMLANGSIPAGSIERVHAACEAPHGWPWAQSWWKPKDRRSALVRAGALIAAEIDRLDRAGNAVQP